MQTALFYHDFPLFWIIELFFLISVIFAQIFNPSAKFLIPMRMPTNSAKAEIETHPLITKSK